jgi:PhzF family phenazine biosynthesis protein
MSRSVPFRQVDVFTAVGFRGNPVAVILDARHLSDADMQRIANWTNLSETTFVLPATAAAADYRLRIFTPRQELPFAGHPSVGTAHAMIEAGLALPRDGALAMECAAGVLPLRIEGDGASRRIFVRAPRAQFADPELTLLVALSKALGVTIDQSPAPCNVRVGPVWTVVDLQNEATVRGLQPDLARCAELTTEHDSVGIAVYGRSSNPAMPFVVRCFCPADGIPEDPVTGSGQAAVAAYLRANQLIPEGEFAYAASQGREVGRDGVVHVRIGADDTIDIGGHSVTCIEGTFSR